MHEEQCATLITQILDESLWSVRFPLNRTERLAPLAHPRHDPIPKKAGIYRVHMEGVPVLAYVGQSKDLRRRVNELRGVDDELMPYTDPHIAGPSLWSWRQFPPQRPYTVTFAAFESSAYFRQGLEDLVIAHARWQVKRKPPSEQRWRATYSPLASFHKMPAGWVSSSPRSRGYRGGPSPFLSECHTSSIAPVGDLDDQRDPVHDLGWGGHVWSAWSEARSIRDMERAQGLYRLRKSDEPGLLFIGHGNLEEAARSAARAGTDLLFSSVAGPWSYHEQLELLTDALGLYLCKTRSLPLAQYGGDENQRAGSAWPLRTLTNPVVAFLSRIIFIGQRRQRVWDEHTPALLA